MFDSQVLAFTLVVAALAFTPGADTMLVVKNGIRSGRPAGWATTFGVLGGTLLHAVISALGLSIVLAQSATLFQFIKLLGALYLIWLGLQALRQVVQAILDGEAHQDRWCGDDVGPIGQFVALLERGIKQGR